MADKADKLFGRSQSASDNLRIWQIKFLEDIALAVGGGGGGGALALESTQISVLNAIIAADQDIEILLVRDDGAIPPEILQQITNYQTGVPVVTYKDVNGTVVVPVGPLTYIDASAAINLMLAQLVLLNAGGQLSTEATLAATNVLLTAMDVVLDNIKLDTAAIKVATEGINTKLTPVAKTPLVSRITTLSGGTTSGQRSISFFNAHATVVATIGGAALNPGEFISFDAGGEGDTLDSITIVVTGGDIIFTQVL